MNKDLLRMDNLSKDEILDILNLADQLKYEQKHGIEHHLLKGKSLGMIFEKASTRTRVSFEIGMYQLGGHPLFLSSKDLQIGRGEPIQDTARVLSRYLDGIMIRTFSQNDIENLAEYSSIPIINGLTDNEHPCQVLADLMTIREKKLTLEGLKVAYIGDGNNMCNSLIIGSLTLGMNITIANPLGYNPPKYYIKKGILLSEENGVSFEMTENPADAIKNADVIITDVWSSMGQENEVKKRQVAFKGYQINSELMKLANNDAIILHCLPAHREEEITEEILESYSDIIFEEAENRLHVQKSILVKLLS